ncbi:hypothetical protein MKX01_031362 [Papaver californicum]|nr:hypothetical protein MKX01_031362 [Papaver californicum]
MLLRLRSRNGFLKPFIKSLSTAFNHPLLHFSDTTTSTTTSTNPKPPKESPLSSTGFKSIEASPPVLNFCRQNGFKPKINVFRDLDLSVSAIKRSNWLIQPNICGMSNDKNQKFLLSNARHFMNKPERGFDKERSKFISETILGEVRIRFTWTSFGLGMTWFTCYWYSEEFIFLLAKPFLTLNSGSHFVCIQLTEALSTYLATAWIACAYFVCYEERRMNYNRVIHLSGFSIAFFLCLTFSYVVPNIWHFFLPVLLISLLEQKALSVESFTNNSRYLMFFSLFRAALSTPPDIWCQIVACSVLYSTIELAMFVALVKQVREGVE